MVTVRASLAPADRFVTRHVGPSPDETRGMLATLGYDSLDAFIDAVIPEDIRLRRPLALPPGRTEREVLQALRGLAAQNQLYRSYIGMGYHHSFTPQVIQRNIVENPGWYTAYTPYQPEIAQGRLEALLNFQTMVADLTALPIANASLLDEATAAAEAMNLTEAVAKVPPGTTPMFMIAEGCHPQTIAVVRTRGGARRADRHRGSRGFRVPPRRDRRAAAVSHDRREDRGLPRVLRQGACRRGARDGRDRPAGPHGAGAAGGVGRGHRRGELATVRRTDGLRRPARGVLRDAGGPSAPRARPHHRRIARCRRPSRAPHGAADARAAHPAREGHEQHLHCAGAPRRDGEHVRRVSRARRAAPHRRARAHPRRPARAGRHPARLPRRACVVLRHAVRGSGVLGPAAPARRRPGAPHQPAGHLPHPDRHLARRGHGAGRPRRPRHGVLAQRGAALHGRRPRRESRPLNPRVAAPHLVLPDAPGVPSLPLRDGDAALHQAARRARPVAHLGYDPARLVHDEAQRHHRDGPAVVARVQSAAPVRAAGTGHRLPHAVPPARGYAGGDHGLPESLAAAELGGAG